MKITDIRKRLEEIESQKLPISKEEVLIYKNILLYYEYLIKTKIAYDILNKNEQTIKEYEQYLDIEIEKYVNRLKLLAIEVEKISKNPNNRSITNLERRVKKTKAQHQMATENKKRFIQNKEDFVKQTFNIKGPKEYYLTEAFRALKNKNPFLKVTTITDKAESMFFLKDNKGNLNIDIPTVNLALDVLENRNPKNYKKLVRIDEYKWAINILETSDDLKYTFQQIYEILSTNNFNRNSKDQIDNLVQDIIMNLRIFNQLINVPDSNQILEIKEIANEIKNLFHFPKEPVLEKVEHLDFLTSQIRTRINLVKNEKLNRLQKGMLEEESTIPEYLKNANIHALDRINNSAETSLKAPPGIILPSDLIKDDEPVTILDSSKIIPLIKDLHLALEINELRNINFEDIDLSLYKTNEVKSLYNLAQNNLNNIIK